MGYTIDVVAERSIAVRFLAGWIIFQLVTIGLFGGIAVNRMATGTYECNKSISVASVDNVLLSMVFPLMWFVPPIDTQYCSNLELAKPE
jgi:hypothetical protein